MSLDVLVVGDANPDLVLTGDVVPRFGQVEQLLDSADLVVGGSATIVAFGLARLGLRTGLCAVVGDDRFGRFLQDAMAGRGVVTDAVRVAAGAPTGLSVILDRGGDRSILTLTGAVPTLAAADVLAAVDRLAPRHVHLASYYLQDGLRADVPALFAALRRDGITTSIDTNWDPSGEWAGMGELLPLVDVFVPNREEALAIAERVIAGPVDDLDEAGAVLSALGCRVVVKAGAAGGVSYADGRRLAEAPGLAVDVVDTTGAGDSFNAGYLAAVLEGVEPESERLRWATTAGSLSVRGRGGTGAQATRADLA